MISSTTSLLLVINNSESIERVHARSYVDNKRMYFLIKRGMDVVVSFLVIVCVLSWLTLLIAAFVLLDSKGPVFFVQRRVGRAGKSFWCFKFRTMNFTLWRMIIQLFFRGGVIIKEPRFF